MTLNNESLIKKIVKRVFQNVSCFMMLAQILENVGKKLSGRVTPRS